MNSVGSAHRSSATRDRRDLQRRDEAAKTRTSTPAADPAVKSASRVAEAQGAEDPDDQLVRASGPSEAARQRVEGAQAAPAATGLTAGELARERGVSGARELRPVAAQPRPEAPPYDPTADASQLYDSMKGGLGVGTDEEQLFGALEGKSAEEIRSLETEYRDHYDRDLKTDIRGELGGSDLRRAEALLAGDQAAATADRLAQAMNGLGTDEQDIFDALEGRSAEERGAIETAYAQRHGEALSDRLASELGGAERERAQALLQGDESAAEAARLREAMQGLGTDEQAVFDTLSEQSPEERRDVEASYGRIYGEGDEDALRRDIERDFGGPERDRALALLEGDRATADAARLRGAMKGLGTDEDAIEDVFRGRSADERAAIEAAYARDHGDLDAALADELNEHELERVGSLRKDGELSRAEEIYFATRGVGTDEATLRRSLEGLSFGEVEQVRAEYHERYGEDLEDVISTELGGRDRFEAELALRGQPSTPSQAYWAANERYAYERSGPLNAISNAVVDTFSDAGRVLERNHARLRETYLSAPIGDGSLEGPGGREVARLAGYVNTDVEGYRAAEDSVSDAAGTVAATAAGVAVTVGSGGTATPLVLATAASAGASARVATEAVISGSSYGSGDAAVDGVVGAVDGTFSVVGAGLGNRVARDALERSTRRTLANSNIRSPDPSLAELTGKDLLERNLRQRAVIGGLQGSVDGGIGGTAGGAADAALRDDTWDEGVLTGLRRVTEGAATGLALGTVTGGIVGAGSSPLRPELGVVDAERFRIPRTREDGLVAPRNGTPDQMATVNRVFERTPRKVLVRGGDGEPVSVSVYGAHDARQAERIGQSLERIRRAGSHLRLPHEVHVRTDLGGVEYPDGRPTGDYIAGLGGDGYRVFIARSELDSDEVTNSIMFHEVGHNIDIPNRLTSYGPGATLFGRGETVSTYAQLNAAEDFAETHRVLLENWDDTLSNPDRYFDDTDVGRKLAYIARNVYRRDIPEH